MSSENIRTVVMAKKEIARKLTKEYTEHWQKRMKLIEQQIGELVEDGYCEDSPIKMSDKRLYFAQRQCWQQFIKM